MKQKITIFLFIAVAGASIFPQSVDSSLIQAIKQLDPEAARHAIDAGASPSAMDGRIYAAEAVLNQIMFSYYDLDRSERVPNKAPDSLDERAYAVLKLLFEKGAKIGQVTSLFVPVNFDCMRVTELLLEHGADPNKAIGERSSPMTNATRLKHVAMAKMLLKYGASSISENDESQLVFTQACYEGDIREVSRRLTSGATVNELDLEGRTALMQACSGTQKDILEYLLLKGADPNLPDLSDFFKYPLVKASYNCLSRFGDTASWTRILELMLDKGAFVSVTDAVGKTALHWICSSPDQNVKIAKILLEAGIKVMQRDNSGKTAMDYAVSGELIKLLKQYGAKEG